MLLSILQCMQRGAGSVEVINNMSIGSSSNSSSSSSVTLGPLLVPVLPGYFSPNSIDWDTLARFLRSGSLGLPKLVSVNALQPTIAAAVRGQSITLLPCTAVGAAKEASDFGVLVGAKEGKAVEAGGARAAVAAVAAAAPKPKSPPAVRSAGDQDEGSRPSKRLKLAAGAPGAAASVAPAGAAAAAASAATYRADWFVEQRVNAVLQHMPLLSAAVFRLVLLMSAGDLHDSLAALSAAAAAPFSIASQELLLLSLTRPLLQEAFDNSTLVFMGGHLHKQLVVMALAQVGTGRRMLTHLLSNAF